MAKITAALIQQLRKQTGIGMLDCKKALQETDGNIEKAIVLLRKKGAKVAQSRAGKETKNGIVHSYIHPGANVGVLVEIHCETDFTANTDSFSQFAHDVCMQITAANPVTVSVEDLDVSFIEKEKDIYRAQLIESGKPAQVIEKILEGKMKKFYQTACLLEQAYIKNNKITIREHLNEMIIKVKENIKIKRFARFQIGS